MTISNRHTVALAKGDGIGPEISDAVVRIIQASGAPVDFEEIHIGEKQFLAGYDSGIPPEAIETIAKHKVLLKGPITTPQGDGYKSLNVTLRKLFGLFANVRPAVSYAPVIPCPYPGMNVVIFRENEEDLYAGIEHRQTGDVVQCLKLVSRQGCERIIRAAFEFATMHDRQKVTCMHKSNIMKLTDGLFVEVFDEVRKEYPGIEANKFIIDIGTAEIATNPEQFDVIVTSNLYGDIISDVAAQVTGSVGLAAGPQYGNEVAMFEAIHGSWPDGAGKNIANPSGMLLSAVQMLVHLGLGEYATKIENAWRFTLEEGYHTEDIAKLDSPFTREKSQDDIKKLSEDAAKELGILATKQVTGTKEFADAVIQHLGEVPIILPVVDYASIGKMPRIAVKAREAEPQELVGVDIFVKAPATREAIEQLADVLQTQGEKHNLTLTMISNRGVAVWPELNPFTDLVDHHRCRFEFPKGGAPGNPIKVMEIMLRLTETGVMVIKHEDLYTFSGKPGFSKGQGQNKAKTPPVAP